MSRRQTNPLRALSAEERTALTQLSRSQRMPAAQVARAVALLAVADGQSYTAAARKAGRRDNDTVAEWVARFNREGLPAVVARHGGGPPTRLAAGGGAGGRRGSADPLRRCGAAAHSGRSPADTGTHAGRHRDVVVEHAATGLAPGRRWSADHQYLHDLAGAAPRGSELAEEPDLVRYRRGRAQTQTGRGHGQRP